MSKHSGKKDREDKARRRLVKAQLELHMAQERRAQAVTRAENEIERTKQRVDKWVAKATERVERRAGAMAQAEANLLTLGAAKSPSKRPDARSETARAPRAGTAVPPPLTVYTPTAAADLLERQEEEAAAERATRPIVVPDSVEIEPPNPSNGSEAREENNPHPW